MESSHPQTPDTGNVLHAAWALMLPHVRRVQIVGQVPSALRLWWERHGVSVDDVLVHGDAVIDPPAVGVPGQRPDMAVVWSSDASPLSLSSHAASGVQEVVVWTEAGGPWGALRQLWRQNANRQRLQRHERLFAWPEMQRVRQIVPHSRWGKSGLHAHRRSERFWKKALRQSVLGPLWAPGWLTRWLPEGGVAHATWLEDILTQASHQTSSELDWQDLRLSPNGVAIVRVCSRRSGLPVGILKVPLNPAAVRRVATNARALRWMRQADVPGAWADAPPRLLASGDTHGCPWTLEEFVVGTEAQTWAEPASRQAIHHVAQLLSVFERCGRSVSATGRHPRIATLDAHVASIARLLPEELAQRLQEVWRQTVRTLDALDIRGVPQHGDCKLENVLGQPQRVQHLRLLDWELWTPDGLPLLDLLHLLLSRRRRHLGVSIGGSICRWMFDGGMDEWEERILEDLAQGLDRRYVDKLPILYWLERVGPVAERGAWPDDGWARANVLQVLERLTRNAVEVVA